MSHARQRRIFDESGSWWFLVRAPIRAGWIIFESIIGFVIYVTAVVLSRPISYFAPRLYWKIDEHLVWLGMWFVSYWMHSSCRKLLVYGDDLEPYGNKPCLILTNHQSDADPLILLVAFRKLEKLGGKMSVVLEDIFHWTHFGMMMRLRGDFFIHQGRDQRHLQASLIEDHIRKYETQRDPRWCLLFPEGGFFQKRKQRNIEYAKQHGYPVLENVLLPRLGAAHALLNAVSDGVEMSNGVSNGDIAHHGKTRYFRYIIDATVAYPDRKAARLSELLFALSPLQQIAVHFRVRRIDHLPLFDDEEQLRKFLYEIWTEKDQLLRKFYETGAFPDLRNEDPLKIHIMTYIKGYFVMTVYVFAFYTFLCYVRWFLAWISGF